MDPRHLHRLALIGGLLNLVGCVTSPAPTTATHAGPWPADAEKRVREWWTGTWIAVPDAHGEPSGVRLQVEHLHGGVLELRFSDADRPARRYRAEADPRRAQVQLQRLDTHGRVQNGCQLTLEYRADPPRFEGATSPGACHEQGQSGVILVNTHLRLHSDQLVLEDAVVFAGIDGGTSNLSYELVKARHFQGWAAVHQDGPTTAGTPQGEFRLLRPLQLGEGTGIVALGTAGGRRYGLELGRRRYPGEVGQVLRLALRSLPDGEVLAYAWADPGARRIGMNLGWFQCGFEQIPSPARQ